jgi:quinol monooxygenase YgiN
VTTSVWTHGIWIVKPGREDEFVLAWTEMAEWTRSRMPEAHGTLLRDREEPNRFHSFGPWSSEDVVRRWRSDPGFQTRVAAIENLLERFEPRLMDPAAEIG